MLSTISIPQRQKKQRISAQQTGEEATVAASETITPAVQTKSHEGEQRWDDLLSDPRSALVLSELLEEAKLEIANGEFDEKGWDE